MTSCYTSAVLYQFQELSSQLGAGHIVSVIYSVDDEDSSENMKDDTFVGKIRRHD